MWNDILKAKAQQMDFELTDGMIDQFQRYMELLLDWNSKVNLTAITDPKDIIEKHFLDSLTCLKYPHQIGAKVIDVGTGAGFPGLPLKIIRADLDVLLMDSLNKRIGFLNAVIENLNLKGIVAVHGRAEEAGHLKIYRDSFDVVYARAVARMNVLIEYCLPFLKIGGSFVCQKGPGVDDEVTELQSGLKLLGGIVEDVLSVDIPGTNYQRSLVVIRKMSATPAKYPRHGGQISKKAL